jgi:2-aminoadipate transaminase
MFLWVRLPEGHGRDGLLPTAVDAGMAFVPGAPFYADTTPIRARCACPS